MGRLRTFVIVTALAAMSATAAGAADVRAPLPPPPPFQASVIEEYASGWYLRGDLGYRINQTSGSSALVGSQPFNSRFEDSYFLGGGVGYKMRWFRADLTFDYGTRANFHADTAVRPDDYYAKMDNFAILANGYLDLGTWSGITPYVGGGIGGALVRAMEFQRYTTPSTDPTQVNSRWNFAWAAMAGVSYNFSSNFLVDLGYRYLSMGDLQTERNVFNNSLTIDDLATHEFRLGVRYMFD
jgi:opacity protein-like surface antigen